MDYKPVGVCSQLIRVDVEDNVIKTAEFVGGCSGNTQGVARLVKGMNVDDAIARLEGSNAVSNLHPVRTSLRRH